LVLAPTRELAQQINEVLAKACVPANLKSCVVFGGVNKAEQAGNVGKGNFHLIINLFK
jgi:superfamily II DNA/RNA helicase